MSEKISLREIVGAILNEIKAILKVYMNDAEASVKRRLKKLIIVSIVTSVLISLGISFIGLASLFILFGSFKYISTSFPRGKPYTSWASLQASQQVCSFFAFHHHAKSIKISRKDG
jgi:hypothetical protein